MLQDGDVGGADPGVPSALSWWRKNRLKLALIGVDAFALMVAFVVALDVSNYRGYHGNLRSLVVVASGVAVGLLALRSQGLYLARVSAVRLVEITRVTRSSVMLGAGVLLVDRITRMDVRVRDVTLAATIAFLLLVVGRSGYRWWLSGARLRGDFCRRVVVLGTDEEATRLIDLFITHPELGIRVVGLIGDGGRAYDRGLSYLWLGEYDDAEELVGSVNASGVVISPSGITPGRMNSLIRNFHHDGVHIHLATGISGIDARRLRSMPLAHEPLLYVEALSLAKTQLVIKRVFDTIVAVLALIVAAPILLVVAAAIKLNDRGPVFFRQQRVGKDGKLFGVLKFRTMRVDAEQLMAKLRAENERNGPLFKMVDDPRVTKVGRFLRESSLDELPQLFNVLRGEMSLVGPRPALPAEVATFSAELRARERVMPGITGLWQVEARDNPSFEAYSRLDLFYVENWSTTLDLIIILGTVEQFVGRLLGAFWSRLRKDRSEPAAEATPRVALQVVRASDDAA